MSERAGIWQENAALRQQNETLLQKLVDAKQALEAIAGGEVDAVTLEASATPVLLHAAQEKLRRNEAIMRAIFDGSLDAKMLADDGGHFVDVNPAACELFGLPREALLGRSLVEFAAPGYDVEATYRTIGDHGRTRGVFPLQRPDGTRRSLEYSAVANVVPGLHLSVLRDVTELVRAEGASHAYRTLLEEAQAIAHIGSWTSGIGQNDAITWSPECYRIFDVPPGTPMTVAGFFELVHPEDRERVSRNSRYAVDRGVPYEVEHRILRPDGRVRWVHERALVERENDLRPTRIVGTVQDITDRRLAVEALQESEAEFRLLAEAMPQIVWITRPDGANVYFNQRWMSYTGLSLEESLGDGWSEPFHPEDKQFAREAWQKATATIGTYSVECRLRRADGVYHWWLIRGEPVRDRVGNVVKWFGTCTDIETLKQSEAILREKESLLRVAGHVARLGAWSVSIPDLHVKWSDEVCAIHEVPTGTVPTVEEAISFYAPEFQEEVQANVDLCLREGTPFDLEVQIVTTSGKLVWVRAIGGADRDSAGAITEIRGAFQDIDDRRKLQEQLRQSQKMEAMGQLAGGVAHDFNNILAVILSYAEFIRDSLPEGDERRGDVLEVVKAGERAADLTTQLLAFSRQQPTDKRPTDLNQSLVQLHKLLVRALGEDIELTVVPSARPVVVKIDPVQFDQIVLNLAVNARDAMPKGGRLRIALENARESDPERMGCTHLKVTDTGAGMDEQTQRRIFEPFFTTKEKGRGTGLGLATCFGIVSDAGGSILVESAPGQGTTFTIELPLCNESAEGGRPLLAVVRSGRGENVLVAEDDAALRRVTARVLASAGFTVHVAADGPEALRQIDELGSRLDVVLTDVVMPGCGGYEVAEHARLVAPRASVLLTSGFLDEAARKAQRTDIPILWKPLSPSDLVRAVAEALPARAPSGTESVAGADDALVMKDEPPVPAPSVSPPHPVPPRHSKSSVRAQRPARVLLVDDDESLTRVSVRMLGEEFDVAVASSLGAARRLLTSDTFDVLIVDLGLPDGNGLEILPELRGPNYELPVVMMTGALSVELAAQALRNRVLEYLPKPFSREQLLQVTRRAADSGRISRVRAKLLAARFGGDDFVGDIAGTEKAFAMALPMIRMAFQPIVRSADGSVFGYEALLRCADPTFSSPMRLFAAAEVLGRVEDVGRAVRASVAKAMHSAPDRLDTIFVNVHPSELRAALLGDATDPLLAMARRVVLEITERASLEAGPKLDNELARIRELGYRVAVDDLGEGYAGLSSLVHLRPEIVKIDMSLVRDIHRMPLKRDIVAALVDMARRSGIIVVAEGVETVDERDTLVDLGCDLLQGYLFAEPAPPFPIARTSFERIDARPRTTSAAALLADPADDERRSRDLDAH